MKPTFYFLLFLLFVSCSKNDKEAKPLPQTCLLESTFASDGTRFSGTKYLYNADKYIVQRIDSTNFLTWGGAAYTVRHTQYIYDKNNYLIKSEETLKFYSSSGQQVQSESKGYHTYTYNSQGQLVTDEHSGFGDFLSSPSLNDTYEYSNGQLAKAIVRTSGETVTILFQSGVPTSYSSTSKSVYELNDQGFIKTIRYTDSINRSWFITRNYDNQQRAVSIVTTVDNVSEKYSSEYDDKKNPNELIPSYKGFPNYTLYGKALNNSLRETSEYVTGSTTTNHAYEYNSDGYPTKAVVIYSSGLATANYLFTYRSCQ